MLVRENPSILISWELRPDCVLNDTNRHTMKKMSPGGPDSLKLLIQVHEDDFSLCKLSKQHFPKSSKSSTMMSITRRMLNYS